MSKQMKLIYPATRWQDALPCGNGKIGALVYGNIRNELIVVNHDRLYLHKYKRPKFKAVYQHLPKAREMMLSEGYGKGFDYLMGKFNEEFEYGGGVNPYQPFCDIHIETGTQNSFTSYQRALDFETSEATVSWKERGAEYKRKLFVSRKDDMIVVKLLSDKYRNYNIGLSPSGFLGATGMGSGKDVYGEEIKCKWHSTVKNDSLIFASVLEDGTSIGAVVRIISDGKVLPTTISNEDLNAVMIRSAKEALVLVKLYYNEPESVAVQRLSKQLEMCNKSYQELLNEHTVIHSKLFNSMKLSLGTGNDTDRCNEQLLLDSYNGDVPTLLIQKMADMGRYLLITSTAQGSMPPNLQGLWNGDYNPAWASDFHNDENIQMNYWAALPGNLAETMLPLFDLYDALLDDFKENAKKLYGCRGILIPISHTTHGLFYEPCVWNGWTSGAGWIAQHYYDYWLYTSDDKFLKERAIPFMKEAAMFYLDFFIEDSQGKLLSIPSVSPENEPAGENKGLIQPNSTMDFAVAKEVISNLINAYVHLGITDAIRSDLENLLVKIPEYDINTDGAIKEWMYKDIEDNYHHRHQSHIYPLFPGKEITAENNLKMFNAFKMAVEKRLVLGLNSQTGWSLAHMVNIFARLGEGDRALECIELLCRSNVGSNLFTYHNDWRSQGISMYWGHGSKPPFQIDANLGLTAAVLEMLVFSDMNMIKILPALPEKWVYGSIENVLCRGNRNVCINWNIGKKKIYIKVVLKNDNPFTIKFPGRIKHTDVTLGLADIKQSLHGEQYILIEPNTLKFSINVLLK